MSNTISTIIVNYNAGPLLRGCVDSLLACPLGIFGRVVVDPEGYALQAGDRIELYRPLLADPKEVRKQRAAKVARVFKKAKR